MALRWLLATWLLAVAVALRNGSQAAEPLAFSEVQTKLGKLRGQDYGKFVVYKGVPYAEKPARFTEPVDKLPWGSETRDATRFGDACVHGGRSLDILDPRESYGNSEDCLYANLWVPKVHRWFRGPLPVIVFIHGGGFIVEAGSNPAFWGDEVVQDPEKPVIYISFNYRLGIFGFYSSDDTGANFGLMDQQQLLKFVHDHISAFGGDPTQVTISGQSAGAMSVLCHLAAPGSKDLFHRAIAISPVGLHYRETSENEAFVRSVAVAAGCFLWRNVTECLRALPALALEAIDIVPDYLFHFSGPCKECDNFLPWLPVVEKKTLPVSPVLAIREGYHHKVPVLISSTANETLGFFPTPVMPLGKLTYDMLLDLLMKDRAPAVKHHYETSPDTAHMREGMSLMGIVSTDALMGCYTRYVARQLAKHMPSYLSVFTHVPSSCDMPLNLLCMNGRSSGAACHACDLPYQLMRPERSSLRTGVGYRTPGERWLARTYTHSTLRFVYGEENGYFAPYHGYCNGTDTNCQADVANVWGEQGRTETVGYHRDHCDFLESIGYEDDPWTDARARSRAASVSPNAESSTPIVV